MTPPTPGLLQTCPVTPDRWAEIEKLFGERGACAGCWCMVWRCSRKDYEAGKGRVNKHRLKRLVDDGHVPGLLGFVNDRPAAWCAVAPREAYGFLSRSRVLAPIDNKLVWSISCLFVDREYRRRGLSSKMIEAAADFARRRGASIVEGYPVEPRAGRAPDAFVWTGLPSAFAKAGFREVARRSETRPIMRLEFRGASARV